MKSNNSVSRRDDNNIPDGATATYLMTTEPATSGLVSAQHNIMMGNVQAIHSQTDESMSVISGFLASQHVMMEHFEATSERTTEHIESMKETFDRTTERILGIMERLEVMLQEQKAKNVREAKSMKRSDKKEEKAHVQ
ncbi:hypothetical protein BKA67DRAFT_656406 [Truncatella angustata]|uniref:Uncharacterized protein n=1 Tax=Truncatella angustata TaxID=152316 RepID=A0A9P8UTZ9_9PEZI|nr:uncharacterized protein BKA67DRAFT_656406 [Truncatella angustata]KAH6658193.1 hypothetical protein BKA67DRAFT_656406 [Truncatella angustata]